MDARAPLPAFQHGTTGAPLPAFLPHPAWSREARQVPRRHAPPQAALSSGSDGREYVDNMDANRFLLPDPPADAEATRREFERLFWLGVKGVPPTGAIPYPRVEAEPTRRTLERFWGEHAHAGYYFPGERGKRAALKGTRRAQLDLLEALVDWSGLDEALAAGGPEQVRILDLGCGLGGTSRFLAERSAELSAAPEAP
jgi:hypothetical protein